MKNDKTTESAQLNTVQLAKERFYKISNSDSLRPFFMSIVSDSNHWMFISSNGGLTAGRKNADYALFPYYTDDKITELAEITGSKSIFRIQTNDQTSSWEPFSDRFAGRYQITRNLYKNEFGNKLIFEEVNQDLHLTFRYQWSSSNEYGFVKTATLSNQGKASIKVSVLDGLQNILPAGLKSDQQNSTSNLVDAYKRSELEKTVGLGIYSLSAIIVDKAEPSEALKANIVWSLGLENPTHLLSTKQLDHFRKGRTIQDEIDIRAEKGAYFVVQELALSAGEEKEWMIMADVNKNHSAIAAIANSIDKEADLKSQIKKDVEAGTKKLIELDAAADGLQLTSDHFRDTRHFANVLFNLMRGGIFDHNYQIEKRDFSKYLKKANRNVYRKFGNKIQALSDLFTLKELRDLASQADDPNLKRLCFEYMPLRFSRRHGDPSRPWNKFSINTQSEIDGSKILDYQGNWRDIFQNWEALAHAYPAFADNMIHKFLNATTFDGYNPYRVTKDGFDWETIEPDDPWSYIGYWGDHQIIYLLKFLEFVEKHQPGMLKEYFAQNIFVYAQVPYKIKGYADILKNPKDTIEFDQALDHQVRKHRDDLGADGALLTTADQAIYQVNFIEKIMATVLAKLSNFIPEGGIWMNTQRPEWNDANNALVGNGVSMVTLYYLRRFLSFFKAQLADLDISDISISKELADFYQKTSETLNKHQEMLAGKINDQDRKSVTDGLGRAASDYRQQIYNNGFSGNKESISFKNLSEFISLSINYLDQSIQTNKRADNLYHAYNLMTVKNQKEVSISYLSEMLEGQVAVLSAGALSSEEALATLDGLKASALFRQDQYSYILYPNKDLPRFMAKNTIPEAAVNSSELLTQLVKDGHLQIIEKDINGTYHFNGNFKNANDLKAELDALADSDYASLLEKDSNKVLGVFEEIFNHKAFTGRSGTFFGYEGLGSIYWHMVSKLLLAVQECCWTAIDNEESPEIVGRLLEHYYEINAGIGVHKSPSLYGAFPTDPYSHTPAGKGAQQPGMTGQVKEDILSRFGELGVRVDAGQLYFQPALLRKDEFLQEAKRFDYVDIYLQHHHLDLPKNSLAFTYCQIPIVYQLANTSRIEIVHQDGKVTKNDTLSLDQTTSQKIFERTGEVARIMVYINDAILK